MLTPVPPRAASPADSQTPLSPLDRCFQEQNLKPHASVPALNLTSPVALEDPVDAMVRETEDQNEHWVCFVSRARRHKVLQKCLLTYDASPSVVHRLASHLHVTYSAEYMTWR